MVRAQQLANRVQLRDTENEAECVCPVSEALLHVSKCSFHLQRSIRFVRPGRDLFGISCTGLPVPFAARQSHPWPSRNIKQVDRVWVWPRLPRPMLDEDAGSPGADLDIFVLFWVFGFFSFFPRHNFRCHPSRVWAFVVPLLVDWPHPRLLVWNARFNNLRFYFFSCLVFLLQETQMKRLKMSYKFAVLRGNTRDNRDKIMCAECAKIHLGDELPAAGATMGTTAAR